MKAILGALILVPVMQAVALAQAPTADAKEGKLYLEGGLGFGVATMAAPATTTTGFDSIGVFGAGFAAEYGITEKIGAFANLGIGVGMDDDPATLGFGMTFDVAYKILEKKGDVPALSVYGGLGFAFQDIDPKNTVGTGKSDSATDFVLEFGIQTEIAGGESWSLQPFAEVQFLGGKRPEPGGFKGYNGIVSVAFGAKALIKLSDQFFLVPSVTFTGGNFTDSMMFGVGVQIRL